MDHSGYIKQTKTMDMAALLFVIKDCREAMAANPENPKNGDYADQASYCGMEITRRHQGCRQRTARKSRKATPVVWSEAGRQQ